MAVSVAKGDRYVNGVNLGSTHIKWMTKDKNLHAAKDGLHNTTRGAMQAG